MVALTLGAVFAQTKQKYQLKILAGEQGLYRSLRWMYVTEDTSNLDLFQGGELLLFTGFSFENTAEFESFIKMLISKNCCGAIVNVGKYILEEDISKELLDLCNQWQFPLISMPWKFYFTDILQEYSRQIVVHKHEQDQIIYVFQSRLKNAKPLSEEDETRLLSNDFTPQGNYCVCVISCQQEETESSESLLWSLSSVAENYFNQNTEKSCVFPFQDHVVLGFYNTSPENIYLQTEGILNQCTLTHPDLPVFCGMGSVVSGAEKMHISFDHACAAMLYAVNQSKRNLSFDEMVEFQLFYSCQDQTVLGQFTNILQPLEPYEQSGNQLTETLRLYLNYNGSINQVSEALDCHRNTINYRIKKISELLNADLDSMQIRFQLQLALSIRDYQRLYHMDETI